MKYLWESEDIKGGTKVVALDGKTYIIGQANFMNAKGQVYSIVNLSNGLISPANGLPREELAKVLNSQEFKPI